MVGRSQTRRRGGARGSRILKLFAAVPAAALAASWGAATFLPAPGTSSSSAGSLSGSTRESAPRRGDRSARAARGGDRTATATKKKVKRRRIVEPQAAKMPWEAKEPENPNKQITGVGLGGLFNVVEYDAPEWYADNPYAGDYFKVDPENNPNVIVNEYPGARDWTLLFWTLVQPTAALGFLIVSISIFQGRDIIYDVPGLVDLFPFLKALKRPEGAQPFPSGAFMGFYGFFGTFLFGPLQYFMAIKNPGSGGCEFNKDTGNIILRMDENGAGEKEMKRCKISEVKSVMMEFCPNFVGGRQEVFLIMKSKDAVTGKNDEWHFEWTPETLPKGKLEEKAKVLADFLEVDVEENLE